MKALGDNQGNLFSPLLSDEGLSYVQEISEHSRGYFKHTLAFAILLKFYEREGRPLQNHDLIPLDLLNSLSQQLDIPVEDCEDFNWEGRSAERFRGEIRGFLGYRKAKISDIPALSEWLKGEIYKEGLTLSQCKIISVHFLCRSQD